MNDVYALSTYYKVQRSLERPEDESAISGLLFEIYLKSLELEPKRDV